MSTRRRPSRSAEERLACVLGSLVLVACSTGDGGGSQGGHGGASSAASASSASGGMGGAGGVGGGDGGSGGGLTCEEACLEKYPRALRLYGPLYLCTGCVECYDACGGSTNTNCTKPPPMPGACDEPSTPCATCLNCAQAPDGACFDEVLACDGEPDCSNLVKCFNVCVNGG